MSVWTSAGFAAAFAAQAARDTPAPGRAQCAASAVVNSDEQGCTLTKRPPHSPVLLLSCRATRATGG